MWINYYKLLKYGEYSYPFVGEIKDILMSIKLGMISWEDYQKIFLEWADKINEIQEIYSKFDFEASKKIILNFYQK